MKQKITLLSFMFFMMLFSFGQMKEPKDNRYYEKSRELSQLIKLNRVDNVHNNLSLLIKSRGIFQNSKVISSPLVIKYGLAYEISQTWDENSSQLIDDWKTEYTYNNKGNVTQYIDYLWNGGQWFIEAKKECSYDANGNLAQVIGYGCGINLCLSEKDEYTYDNYFNLTEHIYFNWDGSQWVYNLKNEYSYDVNGNLIQILNKFWTGSLWLIIGKTEYSYDVNGNISQETNQYTSFGGGQWNNYMKIEYVYDIKGNLTHYILYWWYDNQWSMSDKEEYTYDTNGDLAQYIDYRWDETENQWINFEKAEFTHNDSYSFSDLILPHFYKDSKFEIVYIHQMLSDGVGKIFDIGEMFFNHMMTNRAKYDWDSDLNDWEITDNYTFAYSEQDILSVSENNIEQFKIYPNPVSNFLTIKSEINPIDKVEIYSVLGKKIKTINSDFENINTRDLSIGIYLLRINSEKGTIIKKLIKN